jgi:atypical dual specificity phosphatase
VQINAMLHNFSFVVNKSVAGCRHPERCGIEVMEFLHSQGIRAIVSLDEGGIAPEFFEGHRFEHFHSPIEDFSVPSEEQALEIVQTIARFVENGRPTVVHCAAGIGRTGTILACYLVYKGTDWREAIDYVRSVRYGSVETLEQESFVERFQEFLEKRNAGISL